jgi:hypothetical protein
LKLMGRMITLLPLIFLMAYAPSARAQGISAFFGVGTAQAKSNGQLIDTFGPSDGDALFPTPALGGLFAKFGGDVMINSSIGVGAEYSARFSQAPYAGLNYEPSFYDFNAIWHPLRKSRRIVPEIQGGLGGVTLDFYENQQFCDAFGGCSSSNQYVESSSHFQLHAAAGVRLYVTDSVFVRPQVDLHWVNNFFQFGTDWVPEYSMAIGVTFGRH